MFLITVFTLLNIALSQLTYLTKCDNVGNYLMYDYKIDSKCSVYEFNCFNHNNCNDYCKCVENYNKKFPHFLRYFMIENIWNQDGFFFI